MRSIKVEDAWYDYGAKAPSKSFFRQMSEQITPQILCKISNARIRENVFGLICLKIDEETYKYIKIVDGVGKIEMYIASLYSSLLICSISVFWKNPDGKMIYPWNEVSKGDVEFWVKMGISAIRYMNSILPELYHPVIKTNQSGLPFDYQIHYASEGKFTIYPKETFSENDRVLFNQMMNHFFEDWNLTHERKIHYIEETVFSKKRIVFEVDFGSCSLDTIEFFIYSFHEAKNIRKIIWR